MSVLAQFSMFPVDKGESLSEYVAGSLEVIGKSGLQYELGPMGTSIEGEWDDVIGVLTECFQGMKEKSRRIYISMNIDYREGKDNRISAKKESVRSKL